MVSRDYRRDRPVMLKSCAFATRLSVFKLTPASVSKGLGVLSASLSSCWAPGDALAWISSPLQLWRFGCAQSSMRQFLRFRASNLSKI